MERVDLAASRLLKLSAVLVVYYLCYGMIYSSLSSAVQAGL